MKNKKNIDEDKINKLIIELKNEMNELKSEIS